MPKPNPHFTRNQGRRRKAVSATGTTLKALNQRKVAVHLVIKGHERVVQGLGSYGLDTKLGGVLRIHCTDATGSFEILIRENEWKGQIKPGAALGCDYVVALTVPG